MIYDFLISNIGQEVSLGALSIMKKHLYPSKLEHETEMRLSRSYIPTTLFGSAPKHAITGL